MQPVQDNQPSTRKREEHLSKDGKWRPFPKVPHLLQYVISGNYFGKVKINGKTVRQSLQTTVWSTAQLRLNGFLKENRENRNKVDPPKFSEAVDLFKREIEHATNIKPQSKKYRLWCLGRLQKTWPELREQESTAAFGQNGSLVSNKGRNFVAGDTVQSTSKNLGHGNINFAYSPKCTVGFPFLSQPDASSSSLHSAGHALRNVFTRC